MRTPTPTVLATLPTEQINPRTRDLDRMSTAQILAAIHREDAAVAAAVYRQRAAIARAVDRIVASLRGAGRLIYVGAGTSGRLGVLDASEIPPTFNVAPQKVVGLIAGGKRALYSAAEGAEDDPRLAARDLARLRVGPADTVVGIAASGRTPYTVGALRYAARCGAATIAVACVSGSELARAAQIAIEAVTGPEVIAGSTRMKAGTAQKLILNMLSTAAMIRLGYVHGNLMVNLRAKNAKLRARAEGILATITGLDAAAARRRLRAAGGDLRAALQRASSS
ncbi:MAG: N-acetylmuramic acid 6-phosphate etherase [Terriglobales bacterium]